MPRWLFVVLVLAVLQGLLWVLARSLRFFGGREAAALADGDGVRRR